ncbi:MAG: DUF4352 domain-containing protein [Actinomycetota bacterium]|nr:DUF4352 domain-containing protein [Actinomycetota bacterium]
MVATIALGVTSCTGASSSAPPASLSISPTLTPEQLQRQPEVSIPFSEQRWARGMRRYLFVAVIPHPSDVCANYGFRNKMTMLVAYQSDCGSFTGSRRDDLFFYVAVRNVTDKDASFALSNFTLDSQDGRSFRPAPAGPNPPSDFLPQSGTIPPRSNLFGYLTFDADAATVVPRELRYVDGDQTLAVVFDGEPAKAGPGN